MTIIFFKNVKFAFGDNLSGYEAVQYLDLFSHKKISRSSKQSCTYIYIILVVNEQANTE